LYVLIDENEPGVLQPEKNIDERVE